MAVYEVVYNRHDKLSSDAHVGSHPTPTSTVVAPLAQASVAVIEADSIESATSAVRVAYGDPVSDFFVRELTSDESAGVVVAVHHERPVERPIESVEVAAGQPTQERPTGEPVTLPDGHRQEAPSTTEAPSAGDQSQGTAVQDEPSVETPAGTPVQEPVKESVPDETAHQAAQDVTEASDPARGDGETTSVNTPSTPPEEVERAAEVEADRTAEQSGQAPEQTVTTQDTAESVQADNENAEQAAENEVLATSEQTGEPADVAPGDTFVEPAGDVAHEPVQESGA